jgi:hypothetical protein
VPAATTAAPEATTVPAPPAVPEFGRAVAVAAVAGAVLVRPTPDAPARLLSELATVPDGAHIDARRGTVELVSALDALGTTQTGRFRGGVFGVRQPAAGRGMTRIELLGGSFAACRARAADAGAHAAAKRRKPVRRLWGSDDHGRFQTSGRGSVATVRGTRWLTEDSCEGTLTRVEQGAVSVYDRATHRAVVVRAGHSYLARRAAR